jgi:hypothetical protein
MEGPIKQQTYQVILVISERICSACHYNPTHEFEGILTFDLLSCNQKSEEDEALDEAVREWKPKAR